jgi:hypothetical protein
MNDCTSRFPLPFSDAEVWAEIPDFGGRYLVSNLGRVRSRPWFRDNGNGGYVQQGRIHKPNLIGAGYPSVNLRHPNKGPCRLYVHRLVAEMFVLGRDEAHNEINHVDGDKTNNRADNLQWCTRGENLSHAHRLGLKVAKARRGEENHWSRLTEDEVREIRRLYATGNWRQVDLGAKFRTPQTNISAIVRRKNWTHIT